MGFGPQLRPNVNSRRGKGSCINNHELEDPSEAVISHLDEYLDDGAGHTAGHVSHLLQVLLVSVVFPLRKKHGSQTPE